MNSERDITYYYDIANRVLKVDDNGNITRYKYDRLGRVKEVVNQEAKTVGYEHDELGRRQKLTYPDGSYITYHYDELGRLADIKDDSTPDPVVLAHYDYDELSRRESVTYGNGSSVDYDYEDLVDLDDDNLGNRPENLTNTFNGPTTLTFDYTYDDVGSRLTMTVDSTNLHSYDYDNIYQLKTVDYPTGDDATYNYDYLGNRTTVVIGTTTTSYLSNNNLLNQYDAVGPVGSETAYSYDNNGNLTYDGVYTYIYDYENRLLEVKQDVTTIATYSYDFAGRRISKTVGSTVTKYCYDGDQVIAEYEDGSLVRKFIYGPGIDEPICMIDVADSNAVYYYHFDGLGSVIAISDANADIVERYSYDVFGVPNTVSNVNNPYMFTGRRFDPETALYYYRARYYAPDIGRFLQTDPIGYAGGLNLYTYVGNNPINWIDPYGLCEEIPRDYSILDYKVVPWGEDPEAYQNWDKWRWVVDLMLANNRAKGIPSPTVGPIRTKHIDKLLKTNLRRFRGMWTGYTPYLMIQEYEYKKVRYRIFWKKEKWVESGDPYYYNLVGYPGSIDGDMYPNLIDAINAIPYGMQDFYTQFYYGYTVYNE